MAEQGGAGAGQGVASVQGTGAFGSGTATVPGTGSVAQPTTTTTAATSLPGGQTGQPQVLVVQPQAQAQQQSAGLLGGQKAQVVEGLLQKKFELLTRPQAAPQQQPVTVRCCPQACLLRQ